MDLNKELIAVLVNAQLLHIRRNNDSFTSHTYNYLRKIVVYCGRILEENESYWGWRNTSTSTNPGYRLDKKTAVSIFILLLTEAAKNHNQDKDKVINEVFSVEQTTIGFIEALETLIQSCLNNRVDFNSFFCLLTCADISHSELYSELCAHFSLNRFRISKGYMGMVAGNYIPSDPARNWCDMDFAVTTAYSIGNNVNAIDLICRELEKVYCDKFIAKVTSLRND